MQNEITKPSKLLNELGILNQKGWSRKAILEYNRKDIKSKWYRIKEWDYYAIITPNFGLTFTVADLGIMGLFSVTWLDFVNTEFITNEETKLFTRGKTNLPFSSEKGDIHYKGKNLEIEITRNSDNRSIKINYPTFNKEGLHAEMILYQDPDMDSIVMATPWKNKAKAFYYNQKVNCMPASGVIKFGKLEFKLSKEDSFGVLDWGRGVWPYKDTWYWGSASGMTEGVSIGFNIGYGFGDLSNATENIIFYDGKGHKIDQVDFVLDDKDFLKPWKFTSNDGRFEMEFEPIVDRNSKVNLIVFKSVQHQVFGYFSGTVKLDDGRMISVDRLLGFAEKVYNRW
ncbi:MAG: DUF2804 domain-containing protein [Candidatus Kariarchaeaceae archaeon]|jgi:hypothetical protein